MKNILIKNVQIVNEGQIKSGSLAIASGKIKEILGDTQPDESRYQKVIDGEGDFLLPGVIDDQVHFREPGLTHKADIYSESKAAVAGGVTSFMEMPNTVPQTVTQERLEDKYKRAEAVSLANYSFYMGATNDNLEEVLKTNPQEVCGIKIFMGSSTGNMLVDNQQTLSTIFKESPMLIATHCEDEATIRNNIQIIKEKYGNEPPFSVHPLIRNAEACYKSSSMAVELAEKYNTRLHVLHISTEKEMALFRNDILSKDKKITSEVCIHHLFFNDMQYPEKEWRIKWNPAVKSETDRQGLWKALLNDTIDVIATDHAPHTLQEKQQTYFKAPSGGPMVQHALPVMLDFYDKGMITLPNIVQKMCHSPADIFKVSQRGYIREGYWADLVLVKKESYEVKDENVLYKCGWTPLNKYQLPYQVKQTFVNGHLVVHKAVKINK